MITFDDVSKSYPNGHQALSHVSLHVEAGEMVFVTGHSGAGKSTLLRLVALVERCTQGQVLVGGQNLGKLRADHRLLPDRTVFDNVALPLVIAGYGHQETGRRVRAALDTVGLLGKERQLPEALSGGEQQRVGIARAVVNRPAVLLADEPTGNLDPELSREVMGLFERFHQVGVTVLIASHDLALIRRLGKRIVSLHSGRLVADSGAAGP
ncbi:MAG: ATP-binding cassette domain-containing protein [Gammaproteobacteria bacterium]|nr:ATP-binding cassette domain-containing protein [Gammaproteobacteria bacterium]